MVAFITEELRLIKDVLDAFADPDAVAYHLGITEEEAAELVNGILRKLD